MGFFFLIMIGLYQRSYESKVFGFTSEKMDSNAELAGFVFPTIDHLALNFYLVFVQIEEHQREFFRFDFQQDFNLDSRLAHIADHRDILLNHFAVCIQG